MTRQGFLAAIRWIALAVLVSTPMVLLPRLLDPGDEQANALPWGMERSILGIVEAVVPARHANPPAPAKAPTQARKPGKGSARRRPSTPRPVASSLVSVTTTCPSCRVARNPSTGEIRVTLGSATTPGSGSAFARLDFGGATGVSGGVRVHDRIGLDPGQVPQSDLSVLQVTDVNNRVAYRLKIDRLTRILRLVSPPGGLSRAGLDLTTNARVPNDGTALTVDVTAQAGASLLVRVDGRTVISRQNLSGGDAVRQRYVAVGLLGAQSSAQTLSVTHGELRVGVPAAEGSEQTAVSAADLTLTPSVSVVAPVNLDPPTISGVQVTGSTLTSDPGSWSGASTFRVIWSRCAPDGSGCQPIPNANEPTYVPGSNDAGQALMVTVTASNDGGSGIAASTLTGPIEGARPLLTAAPAISGVAIERGVLTGSPGTWLWREGPFAYSWQRCNPNGADCAQIDGATTATLTLRPDDRGFTIRLTVTAPGVTGSTTAASRTTDVVQAASPLNRSLPAITGNATTGAVLTASSGEWTDPSAAFKYSWERCTALQCLPIAGADADTYRVAVGDVGGTLRVTVTALNAAGSAGATSPTTAVVSFAPPTNLSAPAIAGDAIVGATLTASSGTWSDPQAAITVAWQRCAADGTACSPIPGATGNTYLLAEPDAGSSVKAIATATDDGGQTTVASPGTPPVAPRPLPLPQAPASSVAPTITGDPTVTTTLTLATGTWSDPQAVISVAWQRCAADGTACAVIPGATGNTYLLAAPDLGTALRALVTATNAGGPTTVATAPTAPITPTPPSPPLNSTPPAIHGDPFVSSRLVVDPGTWSDAGAVIRITWQRCAADGTSCSEIAGAATGEYSPTEADVGSTLVASVTATNAGGTITVTTGPTPVIKSS